MNARSKWVMTTALVVSLFWLMWNLLIGPIPWIRELVMITVQDNPGKPAVIWLLPFGLPRHLDALILPLFVWLLGKIHRQTETKETEGNVLVGFSFGLVAGLLLGLFSGLLSGLFLSLITGLLFSLLVGFLGGFFASFSYSIGFGMMITLGWGGVIGLAVCLSLMLVYYLIYGIISGLNQIITRDDTSTIKPVSQSVAEQ